MLNLKYHSTWNGHCQVYYRDPKKDGLYCFQLQSVHTGDFRLLSATPDGEPSCPIKIGVVSSVEHSKGDESTDRELNAFLDRCPVDQINVE